MRRFRLAADVAPNSTAVTRNTLTRMVWPMRVPRLLIRKDGVTTPYRQIRADPKTRGREIWAKAERAVHLLHMGLGPSRCVTGGAPLSLWGAPQVALRRRASSEATSAGARPRPSSS